MRSKCWPEVAAKVVATRNRERKSHLRSPPRPADDVGVDAEKLGAGGTFERVNNRERGFGYAVAVSGNTVVCGAPAEDGGGTGVNPPINNGAFDSGAAYVFARSGTTWTQQAYLKASNTGNIDQFGIAVAVSDDTVVVGAPREDGSGLRINPAPDEAAPDSGAASLSPVRAEISARPRLTPPASPRALLRLKVTCP